MFRKMKTRYRKIAENDIKSVLELYGLEMTFSEQKEYINYIDKKLVKVILSVLLENGNRVVIKFLHEQNNLLDDRKKIEKQSAFSEFMRQNGINTPKRYMSNGLYCNEYIYGNIPCNVTVEDWCGEEITTINSEISYKIGELMAHMHILSLENRHTIGYGTLFSAAYQNDVDAYKEFCKICKNKHLDQSIIEQIKNIRDGKIEKIRSVWDSLPKATVQGDISINNLVYDGNALTVFDYNNAGDEVLISDLVLEGLLTAYEMDLPDGVEQSCRECFFHEFLNGYLSIRKLSEKEADVAWIVYTLYHSLWFSRILYNENSLVKLVENKDYFSANQLLSQMLADINEKDDGRFRASSITSSKR